MQAWFAGSRALQYGTDMTTKPVLHLIFLWKGGGGGLRAACINQPWTCRPSLGIVLLLESDSLFLLSCTRGGGDVAFISTDRATRLLMKKRKNHGVRNTPVVSAENFRN